ncbi:MAG: bifunctional folylpolyglutamate synthase/dihydrofolate synthase [Sulfurovum sp.]|nr:bifunctional folylpolyglutamate synthase/dihydrofolate synthase [Sulfurovum sp.]
MSVQLKDFLDGKPLYYKEIDHERVHVAYGMLKPHIRQPKTVHIVGTNGKGSTGRMIAHLAFWGAGNDKQVEVPSTHFSVGHYSSPHILKFNERIWLDGADASDAVLEAAHQRLYGILGKEMSDALSYFEYTTLLAFVVFEKCDLMVLEAGLGGEFDATNVCDKELSVITPIGIDHQAFLGESIEEIAATKIRSIQKKALLAPQPYDKVVEVAKQIAKEKKAELFFSIQDRNSCHSGLDPESPQDCSTILKSDEILNRVQDDIKSTHYPLPTTHLSKGWPDYLLQNASVALQALDILSIEYDINDLKFLELFGRFYPVADNIRIDVGHNPLAAKAIVQAMEPETVLIYNSLDDKDYEAVLRTLKPKVKRVEIITIDSQRATTKEAIVQAIEKVGLPYGDFNGTIDEREHYLVFGSFYTVEAFLKAVGFEKSEE